jgi:outer membrane immunogenic protein
MRKLGLASCLLLLGLVPAAATDIPTKSSLMYSPEPIANWAGLYGGVHLGAAWGYFRPEGLLPGPNDVGGNVTFGGQVGYNWQAGRWVYGVEGDVSWIDINARSTGAHFDEGWMATLRGRLGFTLEQYLLYATAGVGFTQVDTGVVGFGTDSAVQAGFAGGFGVERYFSPAWSGRIEGLFVDVPTRRYNNGTFATGGGSHDYVLRAAANYHWLAY